MMRKTMLTVTNFLHCGDDYLFIHRSNDRWVDGGKLNGIGGKLESGENYLHAAIRETQEETGYVVEEKDIELAGVVRLEEGYPDDWVMVFFKIKVADKNVPFGMTNSEGELLWLHKDKVLNSGYELVDDLNYIFNDIASGKIPFFMSAKVNDRLKIESWTINRLGQS
ncbi:MAG: NUDIX domain-containing protein [Patescibacteria group bacterium]